MDLRVGIVGAGRTGFHRANRLINLPGIRITAVADPYRPARDRFARTFGASLAASDHRRLAADSNIDVMYICSPPVTHSAAAIDSLRQGKHVICEQPMAINLRQADEMLTAAEESDRRLFVALPERYDPVYQEVARMIDADEIGYPFLALVSRFENEYDRLNDWHDWKGTWDIGGGGVLIEKGSETIDLLIFLFGSVDGVSAVCTRFAIEPLNKAEDSCVLGLEFTEDFAAEFALTAAARYSAWPGDYAGKSTRLEIFGLEGSILVTDSQPRLIVDNRRARHRVVPEEEIKATLPTDMDRDFLDCIRNDREPLVTAGDARDALAVILAAYKSSQMKRRVEILEQL